VISAGAGISPEAPMSDEKQNPAETEEATPEEVVKTESTDLPDGAVEGRTGGAARRSAIWSLSDGRKYPCHDHVTRLGWANVYQWNSWRESAGEKIRLDDPGKEYVMKLSSLRGFNLSGMDLSEYDLKGKDLSECNLTESVLNKGMFTDSDFTGSGVEKGGLHWFRSAAGKI
jgi:hypothetical protein